MTGRHGMRFSDRAEAGRRLGVALEEVRARRRWKDPIVLAIPPGGVPVGAAVACVLRAPLDALVVRTLEAPGQPGSGIGAVVGDDPPVTDRAALRLLGVGPDELDAEVARQRREFRRRQHLYRGGRPAPELRRRTVIVVDDGLSTGAGAYAALLHVRARHPASVVLAVPVCSLRGAAELRRAADDVVCLQPRQYLHALGVWYEHFHEVSDREVLDLLASGRAA